MTTCRFFRGIQCKGLVSVIGQRFCKSSDNDFTTTMPTLSRLDHRPCAPGDRRIRKEMRRRAAIEPVIGHLKADDRMDRNYLAGFEGDRSNAGPRRRRLQLPPATALAGTAFACLDPACPAHAARSRPPSQPPKTAEPASRRVLHERLFVSDRNPHRTQRANSRSPASR
jgi:hypothetical protein